MLSDAALLGEDRSPIARGGHPSYDLVLLDRDGTLNVHRTGYVDRPGDLVLLPGAAEAVRRLGEASVRTVLVTNQRGMATGALTRASLLGVQRALVRQLADAGANLDAIQLCPHQAGACDCRKPRAGLLREALRRAEWARPQRCVLIGDADSDLEPAQHLGMSARRVGRNTGDIRSVVDSLLGEDVM